MIVGNGPAGFAAASAIRARDPRAEITVVTEEPHFFYSRVLLSRFLGGGLDRPRLFLAGEDTYRSLGIKLLAGRRAISARGEGSGEVELDDGSSLPWDRLLLAPGSSPVRLEAPGADLPGVFYLRTLEDARAIAGRARRGERALVVGGGMIGFKATEGLLEQGMRVTMVVSSPRVLSQALDAEGSRLVEEMLAAYGVTVLTGVDVVGFSARGENLEATLSDGKAISCRLAVVGKGVRPNLELARALGLRVDRGILCDQYLSASRPGVFAAGDAAQVFDPAYGEPRVNAVWPHAVAQGRIAGINMVDGPRERFWGGVGRNAITLGKIQVISGGLVAPRDGEYEEVKVWGPGWYRKLTLRGERAVGAAFVGDVTGAGVTLSYVCSGQPVGELVAAFRAGRLHPAYLRRHALAYR